MSEREPKLTSEMNNAEYEVKRDNSQLWTFIGRAALDHIWLQHHVEDDGISVGSRFWRELFEDDVMFNRIACYMVAQSYEAHTNLIEVPETDMDAYVRFNSANEKEPDWL